MNENTGLRNKGKKISLGMKAATYPFKAEGQVVVLLYGILK